MVAIPPNTIATLPRPDRLLLALTRAGDRDAAGELYERYARRIRALATLRSPGPAIDPDDVVQSVFRTFLAGVGRGRYDVPEGRDLWALLVVVATNKVRAYVRASSAQKRGAGRATTGLASDPPDETATDPALEAAAKDVLARFTQRERELIELRLAGHRVESIATQTTRSKRTVERTLQNCRARLLKLMGDNE